MIKYELTYNPIREYYNVIQNGEVVSDKVKRVYQKSKLVENSPEM